MHSQTGWNAHFPWEGADWNRLFPEKTEIRVPPSEADEPGEIASRSA